MVGDLSLKFVPLATFNQDAALLLAALLGIALDELKSCGGVVFQLRRTSTPTMLTESSGATLTKLSSSSRRVKDSIIFSTVRIL